MSNYFADIRRIDKITGVRKKIHDSYGTPDYYRYYRQNGGKLNVKQYSGVIQGVNKRLAELFAKGHELKFPCEMGVLQLRKHTVDIKFVDGKLKTTLPINWKETLELWEQDEDAKQRKILIRDEIPFRFRSWYDKFSARYHNKQFFYFTLGRDLKKKLKENIKQGNVDAYLI